MVSINIQSDALDTDKSAYAKELPDNAIPQNEKLFKSDLAQNKQKKNTEQVGGSSQNRNEEPQPNFQTFNKKHNNTASELQAPPYDER